MKTLLCIILAATPCFAQFTPTNCDFTGVVGCYPFASSANDVSTNHNHGLIRGPVGLPDRFTNDFGAYFFDGENDEINFGNHLKPGFPLTIAAWIKYHDVEGNAVYGIFRNGSWSGSYYGVHFSLDKQAPGRSTLFVSVGNGGSPSASSRREKETDGSDGLFIRTNGWYHVAAVLRNVNDFRLYVGGIEAAGFYRGSAASMAHDSTTTRLGTSAAGTSGNQHFRGVIDDFCIYNRALSTEEIFAAANAPNPSATDSDGDGYTNLDELRQGSDPCQAQDIFALAIHQAVELSIVTESGVTYRVQYSGNLTDWFDYGESFQGTGNSVNRFVSIKDTRAAYFRATGAAQPLALPSRRAVELRLLTKLGINYRLRHSSNLMSWADYGGVFPGTGGTVSRFDSSESIMAGFFQAVAEAQ